MPQEEQDSITAAPAALIGIGASGRRVVSCVRARLAQEPAPNLGGLLLSDPDQSAANGDPAVIVRKAARTLLRQRSVTALETGFAIRKPALRYVCLHLCFVASLAESPPDELLRWLDAAFAVQHPAAGMEILFLLDMTGPDDTGGVVPDLTAAFQALQDAAARRCAGQGSRWSAAAKVRFVPAHPHRADGTWLDHPALTFPPDPAAQTAVADEFEDTLAAGITHHLSAGTFFDGLAAGPPTPPFALWGWARDIFPREPILQGAAALLTADILERTGAPEPGDADSVLGVESMVTRDAPEDWDRWLQTRDEYLLDRRSLLKHLLLASRLGDLSVDDAPPAPPARVSWYRRIANAVLGDPEEPRSGSAETPLRIRLGRATPNWQLGDPSGWPSLLLQLDEQDSKRFEEVLADLRTHDRPDRVTKDICTALAACVDICVGKHLGGTRAAHGLIAASVREAQARVAAAGTIPLAVPPVPPGLGLPYGAGFAQAWTIYQQRCARMPGWPATISAALAAGALAVTACGTFSLPLLLLGWPIAAVSLGVACTRHAWALVRLKLLGDYVRACVAAKYARRILEWADGAAGAPNHDGVYQAVIRYLEEHEDPALTRFEQARADAVAGLRVVAPLPPPLGNDSTFVDDGASAILHGLIRASESPGALADNARTLLRECDIFSAWRTPALKQDAAVAFARHSRLAAWEFGARTLGDFLRALRPVPAPPAHPEAAFQAWVRRQMDRLALRAIPLALLPPSYTERADAPEESPTTPGEQVSVRVAAPASLAWRAASDTAPTAVDDTLRPPPVDSAAADLPRWFGGGSLPDPVQADEADEAACLVLISGLTAAEAASAFPGPDELPASPARADVTQMNGANGANGHGRRAHAEPLPAAAEKGATP